MRKQWSRILVPGLSLGLFVSVSAVGYAAEPPDNLILTILGRWDRINRMGISDPLTVSDPNERVGGSMEGQLFYVPAVPTADNRPLYRLYDPATDDHRDSLEPGQGPFRAEGILGYPFRRQIPGTQPLQRDKESIRRFTIAPDRSQPPLGGELPTDPPSGGLPTAPPAGSTEDNAILGYGFPRYGKAGVSRLVVEGREVQLVANLVAGGAVSELTWRGKQFINDYDYGRQIQVAFNLSPAAEAINPTEAGDVFGFPGSASAAWAHGSPLLSSSVTGKTLRTRCHPLQWNPQRWGGGLGNPVMWRGTIAKRVDLDFGGSPHVIRWITTVDFPKAEPYVNMEVVTAYLNAEFTRLYAFEAATGVASEMTDLVPNGGCIDPSMDARLRTPAGGVVIATEDGAYALGVYRKSADNLFGLCKFLGFGGSGQYGFSTTKWNLLWRPSKGVQRGPQSITCYLLVGSLSQVLEEAKKLHGRGV